MVRQLLILLLLAIPLYAQVSIHTNDSTLALSWEHNGLDINGSPEDSLSFIILLADTSYSHYDELDSVLETHVERFWRTFRTNLIITINNLSEGYYAIGVLAVDGAGNQSLISWSNDCSNDNCFYIGYDISRPQRPRFIKFNIN